MTDLIRTLRLLCTPPAESGEFNAWLRQEDALAFLRQGAAAPDLILYASLPHLFIHAVGAPMARLDPPDRDDLLRWNFNAHYDSWGVSYSLDPPEVAVVPPLSSTSTRTLEGGTKFVFPREFEGYIGEKRYFEILQEFLHLFDLHFVRERKAWCRLDKRGDVEEVIRIIEIPREGDFEGTIILCRRPVIDEWMTLTDSAIVQTFDVTRFRPDSFGGWGGDGKTETVTDRDLMYAATIHAGYGSYVRGVQIIRSPLTKQDLIDRGWPTRREEREHASFIAHDFKHGAIVEISTDPAHTANYFTKSDLPFEMSPAFFRPEVLRKYKGDPEKYRLQDRSITCRGAWHLKTYDINEHGQVHTYIVYLRALPYEEQLHWKAHNEPPRGGISRRAFRTDFEASWGEEYDQLPSLRTVLEEWDRRQVPWWSLRNRDLKDQVHYPVTTAAEEWAEELLRLDQLVIEGFEVRWLRAKVAELGRDVDARAGSLSLLEQCFVGSGWEEEQARVIMAPLRLVRDLRTKLKGHASGEDAVVIKQEAIAKHGSYGNHFRWLCGGADEALRTVEKLFHA